MYPARVVRAFSPVQSGLLFAPYGLSKWPFPFLL
jgi:hypothetical protein